MKAGRQERIYLPFLLMLFVWWLGMRLMEWL